MDDLYLSVWSDCISSLLIFLDSTLLGVLFSIENYLNYFLHHLKGNMLEIYCGRVDKIYKCVNIEHDEQMCHH